MRIGRVGVAAALLLAATRAGAQEADTTELARLRAQIDALTREIEAIRLGRDVVVQADTGVLGFGPAASKVYKVPRGVSIGGYGELIYEDFDDTRQDGSPSGRPDQLDALRGIVYLGYKFNDEFLFNSEIEVEHAATDQAGSVSMEFVYLDYRLSPLLGLRAGLLLPPMGFLNELHEPPVFLGTSRPATEQQIIPSTWRENGVGVFGETGAFAYRAYLLNGFDGVGGGSSGASGFSASGLRGGRQNGSKAVAEDVAGVARLDYVGQLGLTVGASAYVGNAGQNTPDPLLPGGTIEALTFIWEAHGEYRAHGIDLRALYATATIDDVVQINAAKALTGAETIGERLTGWYVHLGYDVLRRARTSHQLIPYVRYETLNTQDEVPAGFSADPVNDREIISVGAAWKPIPNIVGKVDYQFHRNDADTGIDQANIAIGYLF